MKVRGETKLPAGPHKMKMDKPETSLSISL